MVTPRRCSSLQPFVVIILMNEATSPVTTSMLRHVWQREAISRARRCECRHLFRRAMCQTVKRDGGTTGRQPLTVVEWWSAVRNS